MPMPMPSLYSNGEAASARKPRLGIIELVICNIGAMLASIAMDFDVRLANVSPLHPRLQPRLALGPQQQQQMQERPQQQQQLVHYNDDETTTTLATNATSSSTARWWALQSQADSAGSNRNSGYLGPDYEFSSSSGYAHNTYHGPARHYRPFLSNMGGIPGLMSADNKPLRFTDSPQHFPSLGSTGGGNSNAPTPSPRRKNSTTSSGEDTYSAELARIERLQQQQQQAPPAYAVAHQPGFSDYGPPAYAVLAAPDYFRPIEPGYLGPVDYHDRMLECSEFPHAYDNPSSMNSPARSASRLPSYTHQRTSSNVSSASTSSQSNVNPSFRLEDETDYSSLYSPGHSLGYYRTHSNAGLMSGSYGSTSLTNHDYHGIQQYLTRQGSQDSNSIERPSNLEVASRLRSSLKRSNYAYSSPNKSTSRNNSGSGTPTNPTPPDSLTSEDSSYVSAKDGQISLSRVRFSPVTFDRELLSGSSAMQTPVAEMTSPLQAVVGQPGRASSRLGQTSRARKPSLSELERDFLS